MSDVQRFNLYTLCLLLFALALVAGCCSIGAARTARTHRALVGARYEAWQDAMLTDDSLIQSRARDRVEKWKREQLK